MLGIDHEVCSWHLNQLKVSGFVSKKFATMRSDRLAKALHYYRYSSLSPSVVGRKFGYKNFYSLISYQKKRGIEIERTLNLPMVGILEPEDRIPAIHPWVKSFLMWIKYGGIKEVTLTKTWGLSWKIPSILISFGAQMDTIGGELLQRMHEKV